MTGMQDEVIKFKAVSHTAIQASMLSRYRVKKRRSVVGFALLLLLIVLSAVYLQMRFSLDAIQQKTRYKSRSTVLKLGRLNDSRKPSLITPKHGNLNTLALWGSYRGNDTPLNKKIIREGRV